MGQTFPRHMITKSLERTFNNIMFVEPLNCIFSTFVSNEQMNLEGVLNGWLKGARNHTNTIWRNLKTFWIWMCLFAMKQVCYGIGWTINYNCLMEKINVKWNQFLQQWCYLCKLGDGWVFTTREEWPTFFKTVNNFMPPYTWGGSIISIFLNMITFIACK